ncbi:hypothetical protein SH528x_003155 [Novipirellula sp. SH528]|uniref:hypothetical protein n=1 Tax=Novipirellula sp. SH528 TaxID=3454466 RepID=UPI003F9F4EEC
MTKIFLAAISFFLCVAPGPVQGEYLDDLSQLLRKAQNYWPEGAMECEVSGRACWVDGVEQSYKIRAYWKDRHYRFEFDPLNANQQPSSAGWVVIGGGEGFRFMNASRTALVSRTPDPSGMERYLHVLPNMAWLNVTFDKSFSRWLETTVPKSDHLVVKKDDGSYRLSLKQNGIENAFAGFTRQGLPTEFRQINKKPGERAWRSQFVWLDVDGEAFPQPLKLVQVLDVVDKKSMTFLEINVSEFRTKLKPTDPSLAIPPPDLPLGIPIRDMR